jgi:hypothetical protein
VGSEVATKGQESQVIKKLTTTICLTIVVLLGSAGVSWSAKSIKDYCLLNTKHSHLTIAGKCSFAYEKGDYATALREWKPLAEQGNAFAQTCPSSYKLEQSAA